MRPSLRGAVLGLSAATLFGLSAPLSKLLLGSVTPVLLAGLLYAGASMSLWAHRLVTGASTEAPLKRTDLPRLLAMVAAGGIAAPVMMLLGLSRVSAVSGSLLLNLEAPFTVLLALLVFKEHLGRAGIFSVLCVIGGAAMMRVGSGPFEVDLVGSLLLAGACLCWALDNNLTQRLSLKDPFAIVRIKTLVSGVVNVSLGLMLNHDVLPSIGTVGAALALGCVSYGVSVVLDAFALREVGAAREAAYSPPRPSSARSSRSRFCTMGCAGRTEWRWY